MAMLRNIFLTGIETSFSIFKEAVKTGTLTIEIDDGFTDTPVSISDSIRCIFEQFTKKDVETLSFSDLIQPTDVKALLPFVDVINCTISTKGKILLGADEYTLVAYELDPMSVLYTLLLRKV